MQCPFDHSQDVVYEAKHQCMLKNNVIIYKSIEYNKFLEYISIKYGKNFLHTFKQ